MKKLFIFVLIALLAFFAACVGPSGKGIRVEVKVNSPLRSNQETVLMVNLFNGGDATAKNIEVELSGLSDRWLVDGKSFEGTSIKEIDEILSLKGKEVKGPLIQWSLKAPLRETPFDYSYKIKVRYDYTTDYEGVVKVVSPSYFTKKNEKGGVKGNVNSRAPVIIEIVALFERKEGKQAKEAEIYCNLKVKGLDYETVEPIMKISYRYEISQEGKIRVEPLPT